MLARVEKLDGLCIADKNVVEMWSSTAILEYSLAVFDKNDHATTIWPSSFTPRHLFQKTKPYVYVRTCTWMFIAPLFVIAQNLETAQTPFNGWMVKRTVVHPPWHMTQQWKQMNYWYTQRSVWFAREWCRVKKASLKRLHTLWFCLYNILTMKKL